MGAGTWGTEGEPSIALCGRAIVPNPRFKSEAAPDGSLSCGQTRAYQHDHRRHRRAPPHRKRKRRDESKNPLTPVTTAMKKSHQVARKTRGTHPNPHEKGNAWSRGNEKKCNMSHFALAFQPKTPARAHPSDIGQSFTYRPQSKTESKSRSLALSLL